MSVRDYFRFAFPRRSILIATIAAIGLLAVYLTVLTLVSGWDYTKSQIVKDAPFFLLIVPLFGAQVGQYATLRRLAHAPAAGASATASGGMSGTAMVACCAHFLPTLLPYTGVAAFATVVTAWRTPMLAIAVLSNAAGLFVSTRAMRKAREHHAGMREKDPVCGMDVTPAATEHESYHGHVYHFCSPSCHTKFTTEPQRYAL